MTVSIETVRMAKPRPRKNQSELSDLSQDRDLTIPLIAIKIKTVQ